MAELNASDQASRIDRVVLVGASNLARGISSAVEAARHAVGGTPVEFLVAMGHGRSYGQPSRVLGRTLPGIAQCQLWEALASGSARRTVALVTDVGNDIAYGVPVTTIAGWVEQCLLRLRDVAATTAMSLLPLGSLDRMGPWQFRLAKTLLFPGRPVTLDEAKSRSRELHQRLVELGARHGVAVVEQEGRWYGLDPVHIQLGHLPEAWAAMMAPWAGPEAAGGVPGPAVGRGSAGQWLRLRAWRPAEWSFLGLELGRSQPAGHLAHGTAVSLF